MQRSLPLPPQRHWSRPGNGVARIRRRIASADDRPGLLWRVIWAPFWLWSDSPAPALPRREAAARGEIGLAGQAVVTGIDRVRRRLWLSHAAAALCRGIWLALAFAAVLMLLDVAGGPVFNPLAAVGVGILPVAAGIILALLSQPSRLLTARMLDRSFGLQERLTTALGDLGLGVPTAGERAPVVYLQMADAANAMAALRRDRRLRPAIPVREIVLVVLVGLVLATLAFVRGLGGGLPGLAPARVPEFTPAIERPVEPEPSAAEIEAAAQPPTVQEVLERSDRSSRARRDLQELAAALSDHAVTRPAAEQIARGNYEAAGDQLRESAARASELSETSREALASDLQRAAGAMDPETNGLHEASRDAAAGLEEGGARSRTEMRDLADAVERTGAEVASPGELASQMRGAQQSQSPSQSGDDRQSASAPGEEMSQSASQASASGDPGSGADANAATSGEAGEQSGEPGSRQGANPGEGASGESAEGGAPGQASAPGDGDQPGAGENGAAGDASETGSQAAGQEGSGDSETARAGGGAGTGESGERMDGQGAASGSNPPLEAGEDPADPNVSTGDGAEGDPGALTGANDRVALPSGTGQEGVQTSADGGSALRGSGAGVTAGSGYAVQGEVGQAGPDSNRVPSEHRETVERYFSAGGNE